MKIAKEEFLLYGYQKASLREIAAKANVTKGSIYIYFKSKDDLFCTLVKPAMDTFMTYFEYNNKNKATENSIKEFYSIDHAVSGFYEHVETLNEGRDEMKLLFFCSEGSSYSGFRETIAKKYEENTKSFYDLIEKHDKRFSNNISYLFMHTCALLYISFIEEVLIHDPRKEELNKYIGEMANFVHSGIQGVINQ